MQYDFTLLSLQFGVVVATIRAERGLSQEALSVRAGVNQITISRIERGKRLTGLLVIYKLAQALGMTAPELLARVESAMDV